MSSYQLIGRLLGAVRLLDMKLSDKSQIYWYVEQFFNENYSFHRPAEQRLT